MINKLNSHVEWFISIDFFTTIALQLFFVIHKCDMRCYLRLKKEKVRNDQFKIPAILGE